MRLALDRAIWHQDVGSTVTVEVFLQNALGNRIDAPADTRVKVRHQATAPPVEVLIRAGQPSARASFPAATVGPMLVEATAVGLASATCVVMVTAPGAPRVAILADQPPRKHKGPAKLMRGDEPGAPPTPPEGGPVGAPVPGGAPGGAKAGEPQPAKPGAARPPTPSLLVNPETVRPERGAWTATLRVGFLDDRNSLVQVDNEFPVAFQARIGRLSNDEVTFKAGEYLSPEVTIVSSADGLDRVSAMTPLGIAGPRDVSYQPSAPTRLRVEGPPKVVNARGDAPARITVLLMTEAGAVASFADRDVVATLRTTLGELKDPALTIPRGSVGAETTLTSVRDGRARVSASAPGLLPGEATVRFSFPLLLSLLAALGGVLGHYVMRPRQFAARGHVFRSIVTGVVVGFAFYAAVAFGALRGLQDALPVDVTRVVAGNELGALLVGCLGGFVGMGFWKLGSRKAQGGGS